MKILSYRAVAISVAAISVVLLASCSEEELDSLFGTSESSSSGSSSVSSSSFSPQRAVSISGCPSACLNIDISVPGIPSACSNACPETQAAAQCVAAGAAYDSYVKNGFAGATSAQLTQLYSQYQQQVSLTRAFLQRVDC